MGVDGRSAPCLALSHEARAFNSHPWTASDTVAVKLAFGGRGFWVQEEIYQIDGPYSRAHVHVLLSLDMAPPERPQAGPARKGR